jgi:hypothetical protein
VAIETLSISPKNINILFMDDFVGKESKLSRMKLYVLVGVIFVVVIAVLWVIIKSF